MPACEDRPRQRAICLLCEHQWLAVVPDDYAGEMLACPQCDELSGELAGTEEGC